MKKSILIVGHQKAEVKVIQNGFENSGFRTHIAYDSEEAFTQLHSISPDAIIIELEMPRISGIDFCRELRITYKDWTPLIVISSKNEELDQVLSFELGADDYMSKPIRIKELIARVKSVIRRGRMCCVNEKERRIENRSEQIVNGDLVLDPEHFVVYLSGRAIDLTRKEYELIYYLFMNQGKALSRTELLHSLSGEDADMDERIIDVFISRIRQKIEPHPRNPTYVKTVRNIGYMMKEIEIIDQLNKPII